MTKPQQKVVKVNQRALVDKVLARYPESFAVFRELLQNADDAEASEAQIEFQTSDHAKHSAGARENNGTIPDLNTIVLSKLVVRNNGRCFGDQDWKRLTMIGDGNPHEHKIGAFGVGFYCVFSITDSPKVVSGGKSMSIFFKGDALYKEVANLPDNSNEWTSIEMNLKENMRGFVPKPFDLARFLAATITFMSHLKTTTILFDDNVVLKIAKPKETKNHTSIPLPPKMVVVGKERTMNIKTVSTFTQEISVEITDWAVAAGTKRPLSQRPDKDSAEHSFWGLPGMIGTNETQKATLPASAIAKRIHIASYTVYSAEVTTDPSNNLHKNLNAVTKKDLPSNFRLEMIYFSKEQHDVRAAEETDTIGSVFRGPQGLFPQLDGERQYMSRVFIGQSTAQTTGIGGHISGSFIPTVERGSIDLTNCHIAKWNRELLYVGGFLARLAYETEMNKVLSTWPGNEPTTSPTALSSRDEALYIMRYFSFHTSTPDHNISKILRDAFFGCSDSDCFPILSNFGIRYTKDVRKPHEGLRSFMSSMPTLLPMEPGSPPSVIDILQDKYRVFPYKFSDVVNELNRRTFQEDEMVSLLQWWVSVHWRNQNRDKIRAELMKAAKLKIGSPGREVTLSSIAKFIDPDIWLPWLQSGDPLPPDTIPLSFTETLDQKDILSAFGWQPMTVTDWLGHLISDEVDSAHNIKISQTYSHHVLDILGNVWDALPSNMKSETKELMTDVAWIPTNKGFRKASEAYFRGPDISNGLPVVTANVFNHGVVDVLTEFGVRSHAEHKHHVMLSNGYDQYFQGWPVDIQRQIEISSERHGRHYAESYTQYKADMIHTNDVPLSLEKVLELAGSDDLNIRSAAFTQLSDKFDELYEAKYDPLTYANVPFIPTTKHGVKAHKEVFSDPSWDMMGFAIVHRSVGNRMKSRLQIREAPSARQLIEILTTKMPRERRAAAKWFEFLATKQVLSPEDFQEVAKSRIIPIENQRMMLPRECFLGASQYPKDHHYRRIFTFVDFSEHANNFLKACGVKAKPDCSDVVDMLLENPSEFLKGTYTEGKPDLEKYLTELRSIAVGYDGLSKEQRQKMREAPMLVGCVAGIPNTDQLELHKASEILIGDDMENCRMFEKFVRLAPKDEILEQLYKSLGSEYMNDHVKHKVKPGRKSDKNSRCCKDVQRAISEKLPTLMDEFDKTRLKSPKLPWEGQIRFLVQSCEDLRVEKRLHYDHCVSLEHRLVEHPVRAEITTENSTVILWLKEADQVHTYDVAAALCRLLFKIPKKNDVPCLMAILEMGSEVPQSFNVDRNEKTHEVINQEDKVEGKESKRNRFSTALHRWMPKGSKAPGTIKYEDINELVSKTLRQLNEGEPTFGEQRHRDKLHCNTSKKMENVGYCDEQKFTDLVQEDAIDFINVWKQKTARSCTPPNHLKTFVTIISDLRDVFKDYKYSYNIFWHPEDPELMGFNRQGHIFLNLAHYTSKHLNLQCGAAHIEWYYIVVHEIAHSTIILHDEHHELLTSALTSCFLPSLHEVEAVRNYFGCTTAHSS